MAHQILFTSLPRTLRGGSGYGIAAQTPNVPNVVSEEITKLAGYVEIYPGKDPNRRFNPINYFFYKFNSWYILGRIISAENDYSGRFNYLGQFFVLEQNELQECGPAAILKDLPFIDAFQGEARTLPPFVMPRCIASNSSICKSWEAATGDAGWGGFLAEKIRANQTNPILYDKSLHGTKALALIAESLNLLSPAERWGTTFSTHVEGFPKGNQVRVRMLQQGGDLTREFKSNPGTLDLTKSPLELGTESGLITEARTGERPSAVKEQLLRQPEPVVVVGQTDFDNSGPIGLAVEAGMPEIPGQKSKNWVATPPNLTPPKMGKQNRINYGRDTDEFPKETFDRNRKSGAISPLFWALSATLWLVSFLVGMFFGTYISKSGLDETQQKVEVGNEQVQTKDDQIAKLNLKIDNLNNEFKKKLEAKDKLLESKESKLMEIENQTKELSKYRDFIVNETGWIKNKEEKSENALIKSKEELKKLQNFYKENTSPKKLDENKKMESLMKMPEEFKSAPEDIDRIKNVEVVENNDLKKITKFDKYLGGFVERRFDAEKEAINKTRLIKQELQILLAKQNEKALTIKNNSFLSSDPKTLGLIFGESSEKDAGYAFATEKWINEKPLEFDNKDSERSKVFLNRCVCYFLEKIKKDEFFSNNGLFDKNRFIFLKNNGLAIKKTLEKLKNSDILKEKGKEIDTFNHILSEVFDIK